MTHNVTHSSSTDLFLSDGLDESVPNSSVPSVNTRNLKCAINGSCENKSNVMLFEDDIDFIDMRHCRAMEIFSMDDVIEWKYFPRYWLFARGIYRSQVDSHRKGQALGIFMFSLVYPCTNGWTNNRDAADLRHHLAHYDGIVMNWWFPVMFVRVYDYVVNMI